MSRLLPCLAMLAILLGSPDRALAHAVVLETIPADGAVLRSPPAAVVIRLNEPAAPIAAQVLDANGRDVALAGALTAEDNEVRIALPADLPDGVYVASYRLVSVDSHPISGSVAFSIGAGPAPPGVPVVQEEPQGWRVALTIAKIALYACLLAGAGGVIFLLLVASDKAIAAATRRTARLAAAAAGIVAVLAIGLQGGLLLGAPAAAIADLATWRTGLASTFGASAIAGASGAALIAVALRSGSPAALGFAALGAAAALASFALSGHVVTAATYWLTAPVLLLHVGAVAFWVGSLLPLRNAIRAQGRDAAPLLERFSRRALIAVPVLLASGLVIATLQVERPAALLTTGYGRVLLAKLAGVSLLLLLAALNKLRLTGALRRGAPGAARMLRRSIDAELLLVAAILTATGALGTIPPPRVGVADAMPADHAHHADADTDAAIMPSIVAVASAGEISAQATISPGAAGPNVIQIVVTDRSGAIVAGREMIVAMANPAAGIEPIRRAATPTRTGAWYLTAMPLAPAGTWSLRIDLLVDDFRKPIFETAVEISR